MLKLLAALIILLAPFAIIKQPVNKDSSIRAAFYYSWYPENWQDNQHFEPVLGRYDSGSTIAQHIDQLVYAGIKVGIYSWWGQGSPTDNRFQGHLDDGRINWAIYYELDQDGSSDYSKIASDIAYLNKTYFSSSSYFHIKGKPVIFVYSPYGSCTSVDKWAKLREQFGLYVSMTDIPNWWTCNLLDSWHAYRPANRINSVYIGAKVYSVSISAGFYSAWEQSPRLDRNFYDFANGVKASRTYNPDWELYYFNEFGEGTEIEPSTARCQEYLCSDYLKLLHEFIN